MGDLLAFSIGPRRGLRRGASAVDWYERGCALERADPAGAMAAYARAIAGRADFPDAYNNLGRIHHDRGALADAESCYRLAICGAPEIGLYWFNLGVAVEDGGRHAEAIAAYERAIRLGPAAVEADAHYNLARLLEHAGRRAGDELLLRRAMRHLVRYRDLSGLRRAH